MPTIKLTDQLGAAVDVQPAPTSALLRYATALPALAMQNGDLMNLLFGHRKANA